MSAPLAERVKAEAQRLGFVACGITDLAPLPHAEALDRWLKAGFGGNMRYINRQAKKRKDPQLADRAARRAVVVLDNYYYQEERRDPLGELEVAAEKTTPKIARYARGKDYHQVTLDRLEQLAAFLRSLGAEAARPYVDTGPIAERELAQRAGLGWIGKNTMLLRPGLGSWFFIGTVLTDLELACDAPFTTDHCGSCTRCLDACPTDAFVDVRVLDATRCISYLTIEHKHAIPEDLAPRLAGWAFGCDVCNEVCPWNERFATPSAIEAFRPRNALEGAGAGHFDTMDEATFTAQFGDTPLARPGLARMRRNWRAALASLGWREE
ncbi:MAG: tRNA epoxyqueuosine(34) reductase QueG [Gemmatimonadetes bacterium]|nr:tRNA epoxyqueuosine(34) reductase QueG [Gemmatimonadota bacterium]